MNEFIKAIYSPYWWITTVVIAILVNVFSNFVQRNIDRFSGFISKKTLVRRDRRKKYFMNIYNNIYHYRMEGYYLSLALDKKISSIFGVSGSLGFIILLQNDNTVSQYSWINMIDRFFTIASMVVVLISFTVSRDSELIKRVVRRTIIDRNKDEKNDKIIKDKEVDVARVKYVDESFFNEL